MKRVVRYGSTAECVVYLAVGGGLPQEVCRMGYQQWRCGREIPRVSVLELGAVPDGMFPPSALHRVRLWGWGLYWTWRHWWEGR